MCIQKQTDFSWFHHKLSVFRLTCLRSYQHVPQVLCTSDPTSKPKLRMPRLHMLKAIRYICQSYIYRSTWCAKAAYTKATYTQATYARITRIKLHISKLHIPALHMPKLHVLKLDKPRLHIPRLHIPRPHVPRPRCAHKFDILAHLLDSHLRICKRLLVNAAVHSVHT